MIGKSILHYKILEKLGVGGMGVVYKAEDTKLKRMVALKFLPPHVSLDDEVKERFMHEAQAASALDHNNICTIYEIGESEDGQMFISMALCEGETLEERMKKGPLPLNAALNIAIQISNGLAKAHKMEILHRDIKPANIMITDDRIAKILDFGLAKLAGTSKITKEGTTLGTVTYMSPEQARGEKTDKRTDIWALGVILFEMLGGKPPFTGEYDQVIMYSILNEPAPPLSISIPEKLKKILENTLQKDAKNRYQTIESMQIDLKDVQSQLKEKSSMRAGEIQIIPSIAVLPFVNMSTDPENEYFSDGLSEELINALTKLEGLHVTARTSAFQFRGKEIDIRDIGKQLNVTAVLEGSVRKSGQKLRITAQLINVEDGYHIWSEKYDRQLNDIFEIQDEISAAIVDNLKIKLLGKEKTELIKRYTENQDVYHLYLKGRYHLNKRTGTDFRKAVKYFEQVIDMEPDYALAYSGLADTFNLLERYGVFAPLEALPKAKTAALNALQIDDSLTEAHTSLAYNMFIFDKDWEGSEKQFRQAIEINPKHAVAHHWFAWMLTALGRLDEAMREINQAYELDPLSLIINANIGSIYYFARQYDKAIEQLQKTIEIESDFVVAHQWLGRCYEQKMMIAEAINEHKKSLSILGEDPESLASLAHAYALAGNTDELASIVARLDKISGKRFVSQYWYGLIYAGQNKIDQSISCLEKAIEERFDWLAFIKVEPMMDTLRPDQGFKSLLKTMGL